MTPAKKKPAWHTGAAVAELLEGSNRAKAAAALGMGTTITTMYRWLAQAEWNMRNIMKAATYFGVSPEWLMTGQGEKYAASTGQHDPKAAQVEVLYLRLKSEMELLLADYTRRLARLYDENANALPTPKGQQREWTTRPRDGALD